MEAITLPRVFIHNEVNLPDIGTEFSPEEVLEHYSSIYPELACAYIKEVKPEENQISYNIGLNIGSKA